MVIFAAHHDVRADADLPMLETFVPGLHLQLGDAEHVRAALGHLVDRRAGTAPSP